MSDSRRGRLGRSPSSRNGRGVHPDRSRSLGHSGGASGHLAVWSVTGQVAGRHSCGAGVQRAAWLVGLGRSATAATIDEVADLAATGDVPDQAGFVPLVSGCRRDAAADVGAGSGQAEEADEDRQSEGLHFEDKTNEKFKERRVSGPAVKE